MLKLSLEELEPKQKFMLMAALKVSIEMKKMGFSKEKYMEWCSSIWETMELEENEDLNETLQDMMVEDIKRFYNVE